MYYNKPSIVTRVWSNSSPLEEDDDRKPFIKKKFGNEKSAENLAWSSRLLQRGGSVAVACCDDMPAERGTGNRSVRRLCDFRRKRPNSAVLHSPSKKKQKKVSCFYLLLMDFVLKLFSYLIISFFLPQNTY